MSVGYFTFYYTSNRLPVLLFEQNMHALLPTNIPVRKKHIWNIQMTATYSYFFSIWFISLKNRGL